MKTLNNLKALARYGSSTSGYVSNNYPDTLKNHVEILEPLLQAAGYPNESKHTTQAVALIETCKTDEPDDDMRIIIFTTAQTACSAIEDFCDVLNPLLEKHGILADVEVCDCPTQDDLPEFEKTVYGQAIINHGLFVA